MPYTLYTYAQFRQELANSLNDPGKVNWTDGELKVHVLNALRFWNVLTGDNKLWYNLNVVPGTLWYDLQQTAGSPRAVGLEDTDLYSWLQYALIEPQLPNASLGTAQYSTDQLIQSLQRARDEFLMRTACTSTVYPVIPVPNVADVTLRETVILVRRGYWLPTPQVGGGYAAGVNPAPVWPSDEFAVSAYSRFGPNTPGNPQVYSAGVQPPLVLTLTPPPSVPGQVELLTVESQPALSNPPPPNTVFALPQDFMPALYWRTLADLMSMNAECMDAERAKYARSRFDQFCELVKSYPFILSARIQGIPVMADAVENLDRYLPGWEVANPTAGGPLIVGYSGQNLVAFPTSLQQQVGLYMVGSANLPANDAATIQLGHEVMDAVLGYAQHTASFKLGWSEFAATMPLFKAIVQLAATRNAQVRAMATFRDLLYERADREDEISPREQVASGGAASGEEE